MFVFAEDRNNLEKLTLAVLSHLPTAILYVHDLSGECGTSPSDQVLCGMDVWCKHCWVQNMIYIINLVLEFKVVRRNGFVIKMCGLCIQYKKA